MRFLLILSCAALAPLGVARAADAPPAVAFTLPRAELVREHNRIAIGLPGGRTLEFDTDAAALGGGATGVYGRSAQGDRLLAFVFGDELGGDIYASGGRYRLRRVGDRYEWAPYFHPAAAGFFEPALAPDAGPRAALPLPPAAQPGADGRYEVDLLLLYTSRYAAGFTNLNAAMAAAKNLVFRANAFFRTSGIPVQYRLAGIEPYAAAQPYGGVNFGGDPGIVARRNALGADLVAMLENGTCQGQATPFNHATATADGALPGDVDPERDAFALLIYTPLCADADWMLAHELGHTLGGGHEVLFSGVRAVPNPAIGSGYWKEYAHGARCGNAGGGGAFKFVSIMAYGLPNQAVPTDVKGDFFSDPAFTLDGEACGATGTPGLEVTEMNNVRSITQAAPYVAAYRQPVGARSVEALPEGSRLGAFSPGIPLALLLLARLRRRRRH